MKIHIDAPYWIPIVAIAIVWLLIFIPGWFTKSSNEISADNAKKLSEKARDKNFERLMSNDIPNAIHKGLLSVEIDYALSDEGYEKLNQLGYRVSRNWDRSTNQRFTVIEF